MIINRDCNPSVVVSQEGCILSPEIKAMQYLEAVGQEDFFTVISQSDVNFTYGVLRPVQNAVVNGHIWLFNGLLSKSHNGSYCAQKLRRTNNGTVKMNQITRYTIEGKLTVQYECYEHYTRSVTAKLRYDLRRPQALIRPKLVILVAECRLNCRKEPASKLIIKREMKTAPSQNSGLQNLTKVIAKEEGVDNLLALSAIIPDTNITLVDQIPNTTITLANQKMSPLSVKSLIHNLHKRLLQKILRFGFSKDPDIDSRPEYIPELSFKVLNKLRDIVFKSCAGKVPKRYLEFAYVMFQSAYENRGTSLGESITQQEQTDIVQFLNECHDSLLPMKFNNEDTFCPDEIKTVEKDYEYVAVNYTSKYHPDYYLHDRHLTMEIPWNMIDLTLAVCIRSFAESYILYHKMEQAIEKLFIKDLKILWNHPPEHGTFYTRIYGPNWKHYGENLEKCVQAAYIQNPKLTRLKRPHDITMNLTTEFEFGDFQNLVQEYHTPIPIPEITVVERNTEVEVTKKPQKKSILRFVELTCEELDKEHCFYD